MKRLHLFEAVGLVDDRLVEEAADAGRTASPWGKWLASAACVVLVLSLGVAAGGTLLRGCGSGKPADSAAPAAAAPSTPAAAPTAGDAAPEEAKEEAAMDSEPAAGAEYAAESALPEPAEAPVPMPSAPAADVEPEELEEPAAEPAAEASGKENDLSQGDEGSEDGVAEPARYPVLRTHAAGLEIVPVDGPASGPARYLVADLTGADRTETLYFTLDTGPEGTEGVNVLVNGEPAAFDSYEAVVCPAEDGAAPANEERSFLVEFTAEIPAADAIEVEIRY